MSLEALSLPNFQRGKFNEDPLLFYIKKLTFYQLDVLFINVRHFSLP